MANILIRQFDVFANPHPERSGELPFVLVLQSDWLSDTSSVIVAPLVASDRERQARLHPHFEVEGRHLVAAVSDLAAIRERSCPTRSQTFHRTGTGSSPRSIFSSPATEDT